MKRSAAILYPGEMGGAVGAALVADGWEVVTSLWDRSASSHERAGRAGVADLPSLEDALVAAELAISLVPPAAALECAKLVAAAAGRSGARPLYLEANSVAPGTARAAAAAVEAAGLRCVDGAFVGSAAAVGGTTRLYLSGEGAVELAAALPDALRPACLGREVGAASAFKMAFAGFNKGLAALFLRVMATGELAGDPDELLRCLRDFYPGTIQTLERLLATYPRHAARRAAEMAELAGWLASEGQDETWAASARDEFARFAALNLDASRAWTMDELLAAVSRARREEHGRR